MPCSLFVFASLEVSVTISLPPVNRVAKAARLNHKNKPLERVTEEICAASWGYAGSPLP
jgi:hypothetical protein